MVFLKALTVLIVCISIFKSVISESLSVENKNNTSLLNVTLSGTVLCKPCGDKEVTIIQTERGEPQEDIYYANYSTRNFYIHRFLIDPKPGGK
uniref:Uncharacterized protein n=1 Tax=Strongyloides papillosus TaxID=174720 RepID=A0A0N5CIN5_STREA